MPEINNTFAALLSSYSTIFAKSSHTHPTVAALRASVPKKVTGVYVIEEKTNNRILYIGSAGKVHKGMTTGRSSINNRMFGPATSTPYRFDPLTNDFFYGPTTSGAPPAGYLNRVSVANIIVHCIVVKCPKVPSVLEHLLLQGHINQFGDLPDANQQI